MEKLVLLIDSKKKAELTNIFCAYFFIFYVMKYEFCGYLACIYFCESCLKKKFACI